MTRAAAARAQPIPRGHPECLTGKTFVLTGTYEALGRSEAVDLIKRHSGRVTGSVSGKTTFLVAGEGCSKSKVETVRDAPSASARCAVGVL